MSLPTMDVETKSRVYQTFSGVDFSSEEVKTYRSPDSVNMWKDYNNETGKGIETRPGMILLGQFPLQINGLFFYKVQDSLNVLVHSGTKLLRWNNYPDNPVQTTELFSSMNPAKSQAFVWNNILFIKDGINYLEYDGINAKSVEGTIPTTIHLSTPSGAGTKYQDVNLLTSKRKNMFVGDGETLEYMLDSQNIDNSNVVCEVNGETLVENIGFNVDRVNGKVTFNVAPSKSDGTDNVVITFSKTISGDADKIKKCTILSTFDNRVFFSGNQDYPNVLFHSELNDPRYVSKFYNEGNDFAKIKALIPGNNSIWAIKEQSQDSASAFYHEPTNDYDYGKVYPSQQANISTGCVSTGINFKDDIVFLSQYGLEAISGNIGNEKMLAHRSTNVDNKMINETNYKQAQMIEFRGYLLVLINSKLFLADSRQRWQGNDIEYEWYYWELPESINFMKEYDNELYLGNSNGNIYKLSGTTDNGVPIHSKWSTPSDSFGYEAYRKTTNKRGCIANIMKKNSNIKVEVAIDGGLPEIVDTYSDEKGYIVCRIKKKKWKRIQLIFSSNEQFGLFLCTLEVFIGGYIKR